MQMLGWLIAPVRLVFVFAHMVFGLLLTLVLFHFIPWSARQFIIQNWSRALLMILGVRLNVVSAPVRLPMRGLLVSNHTSWIDPFVANSIQPTRFIAKSDIRKWPVLGTLVSSVGTLYVERGNRHMISTTNKEITHAAQNGDLIGFYAEGTTTDGTYLLPFKSNLFQPAIDNALHVHPLGVTYSKGGHYSNLASYIDDMSMLGSFWQLASSIGLTANVHYCPIIPAAQFRGRQELAIATQDAISRALGLEVTAAETVAQVRHGV
jgi:1-acyl-sn-glycerol-3-phosphate acyltransferase